MRNMDVAVLRSFVAVVDNGGVTRAAGVLNLTQSAVSMQIKRLEELLGFALFDRVGRKLVPTAAGEQLLGYARKLVALNDDTTHAGRRCVDECVHRLLNQLRSQKHVLGEHALLQIDTLTWTHPLVRESFSTWLVDGDPARLNSLCANIGKADGAEELTLARNALASP